MGMQRSEGRGNGNTRAATKKGKCLKKMKREAGITVASELRNIGVAKGHRQHYLAEF